MRAAKLDQLPRFSRSGQEPKNFLDWEGPKTSRNWYSEITVMTLGKTTLVL
jgi:hypothetical protein